MTAMKHTLILLTTLLFTPLAGSHAADVTAFLKTHCYDCHNAETSEGNLDLSSLKSEFGDTATFALWVKVHDRVQASEMPPPKIEQQPTTAQRETMLKSLKESLVSTQTKLQRELGRVPMRRLNRTEYENTIRDLFDLPGLQVKEMLPADGRFDGFDKVAARLDMSAVQLRKYLEAANFVLDTAIAHQDKPIVWKKRLRRIGGLAQFGESSFPIKGGKADMELLKEMHRKRANGRTMPLQEREPLLQTIESLGILTHARPAYIPEIENFSPFHSGYYRITTSVWSFEFNNGELLPSDRMQSLALTASGRVISYLDAPSLKPQLHEMVVWLNAADKLELNPANLWGNYNTPFNYVGPGVAVDYVDVEGPLHDAWPAASHRRLFGNLPIAQLAAKRDASAPGTYPRQPPIPVRHPGARPHHVDAPEFQKWQPVWTAASPRPTEDADRLLKDFLPRAFRRPVTPEEIAIYVQIARDKIAAGEFFETAMREAYRVALCSPDFLYLHEPTPIPNDPRVDFYALACRLSYFLWNSMPDDELTELARRNSLHGKDLDLQIERLLANPKSARFVDDFLDQWLDLRKINFTTPDTTLYPEFRPDLRDAMLAETRAYFREMLKHDLGIAHLVDSDFLMINQRLAEHYDIPGVAGGGIRRVTKPELSPRGGLLTQAAILKVTANGTTTSPVLRGAWMMNRLLGRPVDPPPPNVPAVDPDIRGLTTIREQLSKHRDNTACASCHLKMDPAGFSLENFDVTGAWRTQYRFVGEKADDPAERRGSDPIKSRFLGVGVQQWQHVLNNVRYGLPVDATGTTVEGSEFKDIYDFKKIVLADEETLARNLVQRLILYSTGAPVSFTDRAQVDAILKRSSDSKYGLRTLVREIIRTPQIFHWK
ncbi:MAG: hypothetical protein ACI9HK_002001 [Pirellulaceae bacterium]|jgi:hypothetical protein